ncbi:glycosyltransferase family 25 protein [Acinetobacter faecalis]|uniref:glycosyltransferase family 25 protein n=1 Tax=Acinetobacter faecalis TaxID=2665161 RepID=UPI002A9088BE|nr:glycosyltransferase family 25 protein [Acinetobacter faecalis]MDY6461722.1 glycosyltransferase family 25 protein [Acinetobacter faecalis]
MNIQVISLASAIERRKHIQNEFGKKALNFNFFDALTPDVAAPLAEKMTLNIQEERITKGELACFISHVSLWQKMVDENIPYMAIFEDDIFLGEKSAELLNSSDWISSNWHIIKTEAFANKVIVGKFDKIVDSEVEIAPLRCRNLGTAGYILSIEGAKSYLEYILNNQIIPLDEMMFDAYIKAKKLNVYQLFPALCIQEMILFPEKKSVLPSDLLEERKARMKKFKKKGFAKFKVEYLRIVHQIENIFFGKVSEFK